MCRFRPWIFFVSVALDRAALAALYAATDGDNWEKNNNWRSDKPLQSWFGVITDAQGRAIRISLDGSGLEGANPVQLGTLSQLWSLPLLTINYMGRFPRSSEVSLSWLTSSFGGNELSGPIPPGLGNLTRLYWLHLDGNQLMGPIPTELGNLTDLEVLFLSANQLTDGIPVEIGDLSHLKVLHLWDNQLVGNIPVQFENFTNLTAFALNQNNLTGTVPAMLGNLVLLESLYLQWNPLTGALPPELTNLLALNWLFLSQNPLTGCIPAGLIEVGLNDLAVLKLAECADSGLVTSPVIEDSNPTATPDNTTSGSDRAAPEALFASTNGNFWNHSYNWLSEESLGNWYGVTTDSQGRVTEINLY